MSNIFKTLLILLIGCFTFGVLYVLYEFYFFNHQFPTEQETAQPKFLQANETLAEEVPIPNGITEISRLSSSNGYGVTLTIEYLRLPTTSSEQVLEDYQRQFLQKGWLEEQQISSIQKKFYRGTACVEIHMVMDMEGNIIPAYDIYLWYDYRKQKFSPRLPPNWLIYIVEFGEREVLTCP